MKRQPGAWRRTQGRFAAATARVRPPCFAVVSALGEMIQEKPLAAIVPTFDTMNMIGGECDR